MLPFVTFKWITMIVIMMNYNDYTMIVKITTKLSIANLSQQDTLI